MSMISIPNASRNCSPAICLYWADRTFLKNDRGELAKCEVTQGEEVWSDGEFS